MPMYIGGSTAGKLAEHWPTDIRIEVQETEMYCTNCGTELPEKACYCLACGVPTRLAPPPVTEPLMRSVTDRKIAGVCSGFAKYFAMDVTVMRILWLCMTFGLPPAGVLGYVAAWMLMPEERVQAYQMPPAGAATVL